MTLPDTLAIERAGLKAWPGIEVDWDGDWVRRAAGGYTKRANSLQCFDAGDEVDADRRLADGIGWLTSRGLPPVVRTTPLETPALTAALDAQNWQSIGASHVYAMAMGSYEPDVQGWTCDLLDIRFLAAQQALQGYSDAAMDRMGALLGVMAVPAVGVVVERDGVAVASGLMAIADGIVVTGNVIADPARRRQGLGGAMMRTGLAWAKAAGAEFAALNVEAHNAAGKALYASLGFERQYDYCYRIPGVA